MKGALCMVAVLAGVARALEAEDASMTLADANFKADAVIEELSDADMRVCPSHFAELAAGTCTSCFVEFASMDELADVDRKFGGAIDLSAADTFKGDLTSEEGASIGSFDVEKHGCQVSLKVNMKHGSLHGLNVHLAKTPYAKLGAMATAYPGAYAHQFEFDELAESFEHVFDDCEARYMVVHAFGCGDEKITGKSFNAVATKALHAARDGLRGHLVWILAIVACAYLLTVIRDQCARFFTKVAKDAAVDGEAAPLLGGQPKGWRVGNYHSV